MALMDELVSLMAQLRHPETGCPWDREQTFLSIAPYTIEEAYEVAEAIHQNDLDELKSELGDLLFQVVFHARMAEEQGAFCFDDVVQGILDKMRRRHPHVFGDEEIGSAEEQSEAWEQLKAREKTPGHGALDGVAMALPALVRAEKLQRRAARVGFDWPYVSGAIDKCHEELEEVKQALKGEDPLEIEAEIGDLLFSVVNVSRFAAVDAEMALAGSSKRFTRRFQEVERFAEEAGASLDTLSLDALDALWERAKEIERNRSQ